MQQAVPQQRVCALERSSKHRPIVELVAEHALGRPSEPGACRPHLASFLPVSPQAARHGDRTSHTARVHRSEATARPPQGGVPSLSPLIAGPPSSTSPEAVAPQTSLQLRRIAHTCSLIGMTALSVHGPRSCASLETAFSACPSADSTRDRPPSPLLPKVGLARYIFSPGLSPPRNLSRSRWQARVHCLAASESLCRSLASSVPSSLHSSLSTPRRPFPSLSSLIDASP